MVIKKVSYREVSIYGTMRKVNVLTRFNEKNEEVLSYDLGPFVGDAESTYTPPAGVTGKHDRNASRKVYDDMQEGEVVDMKTNYTLIKALGRHLYNLENILDITVHPFIIFVVYRWCAFCINATEYFEENPIVEHYELHAFDEITAAQGVPADRIFAGLRELTHKFQIHRLLIGIEIIAVFLQLIRHIRSHPK